MRPLLAVAATAVLSACAAAPVAGTPTGGGVSTAGSNDCAVIAAVAKDHFRFGPDNPPLPIRFGEGFDPQCDWSRYGIAFQPYVERTDLPPRERIRWVSFDKPRYDGQGALIAVGIMHGPLAGMGYECRVRSGIAGWTVAEGDCRNTWVS